MRVDLFAQLHRNIRDYPLLSPVRNRSTICYGLIRVLAFLDMFWLIQKPFYNVREFFTHEESQDLACF